MVLTGAVLGGLLLPGAKAGFFNTSKAGSSRTNAAARPIAFRARHTDPRRRIRRSGLIAMTSHFVDITVVPDPESGTSQLLGALYDRLHVALVQHRLDSIGVSFPGYSVIPRSVGTKLRLHGSDASLRQLLGADWLRGVRDHVRMTEITPAPPDAPHRTVQRKQFKTNAERLRRRRMQRKGETAEQATAAIPSTVERNPNLPYLHVRSRSTAQAFCLFIALGPLRGTAVPGSFNAYGLGGIATVPWF